MLPMTTLFEGRVDFLPSTRTCTVGSRVLFIEVHVRQSGDQPLFIKRSGPQTMFLFSIAWDMLLLRYI